MALVPQKPGALRAWSLESFAVYYIIYVTGEAFGDSDLGAVNSILGYLEKASQEAVIVCRKLGSHKTVEPLFSSPHRSPKSWPSWPKNPDTPGLESC